MRPPHMCGANFSSFKGHTQKMRIESFSLFFCLILLFSFKGHTQKMRIERVCMVLLSEYGICVSKVILRK